MRQLSKDLKAVKARSEASRKGMITRTKLVREVEKDNRLKARLLSRQMAGVKKSALKREPTMLITGVTNPKLVTIEPKDFDRLDIPEYQRDIQPDEVNEILRALTAGGIVADPITLSRRAWVKEKPEADKLWVVDGQQRLLAHMEVNIPIKAIVFDVASFEAERQLFVNMNTSRVVSANNIISAAASKVATLLRNCNQNPEHPCYKRIVMKTGPGNASFNMGASIVTRGLAVALGITAASRGLTAQKLLPKIDEVYNYEKADAFLRLLAEITPTGEENRLRLLPSLALGKVFNEKCLQYGRPVTPSRGSISHIRRTNWGKITGGFYTAKFLPVVLEALREKWKA